MRKEEKSRKNFYITDIIKVGFENKTQMQKKKNMRTALKLAVEKSLNKLDRFDELVCKQKDREMILDSIFLSGI